MQQFAMEKFIETQNIEAFRNRLQTEIDPVTRATLIQLLMQEEAKLATLITAERLNQGRGRYANGDEAGRCIVEPAGKSSSF